MYKLLQDFYNYKKLSASEHAIINNKIEVFSETKDSSNNYQNLCKEYLKLLINGNISLNDYNITFAQSGTWFINNIFKNQITSQTLIITSKHQHKALNQVLLNYNQSNVIKLSQAQIFNCDFSNIIPILNSYKKIFVYIIGTQVQTGKITPQLFFQELKKILNKHEHKIMIDDVHGMFITPRDYSLFDYILYTAHSLIVNFNMGLLISKKKNKRIGYFSYNSAQQYLNSLKIILDRKDKIYMFKTFLTQYFYNLLLINDINLIDFSCQHIFCLQCSNIYITKRMKQQLYKYHLIKVNQVGNNKYHIRIRYKNFIANTLENIKQSFDLLTKILMVCYGK